MKSTFMTGAAALILTANTAFAMSDAEKSAALTALDDEYKAFATYEVVIETFGAVKPFVSIQQAEATHIGLLTDALAADGILVPGNPYLDGTLPRPEAPESVAEACAIGVQAEIANAALYNDELLPVVSDNTTLTDIFEKLRDASTNQHLPSFERCS